jgi:rod shape-determining protein MreB
MFSKLKQIITQPSIAIDLGTANTRLYSSERGAMTERPSLIPRAHQADSPHISDAYIHYLNSKIATTPLRGGVIVDIENAVHLIRSVIRENRVGLRRPVSLASAPTDTSAKERALLARAVIHAGASHVVIIPEVWAAAIGAGLDVSLPYAQVLMDIGEGVTDMAVIRDGRIIYAFAVRTACSDLQRALRSEIVARHKVCIFPDEAQRLTHKISLIAEEWRPEIKSMAVSGMDIVKGCRTTIDVQEQDIVRAMKPAVSSILKMVNQGLKKLPVDVHTQVIESGICLTGGGACIAGMDRLIARKTGLDVRVSRDPMHSVIHGEIETLNYWKDRKNWWQNTAWPDYIPSPVR